MEKESVCFGVDIERQREIEIYIVGEEKEEINGDREGGAKRMINMEWEFLCVCGGEIKRQRRRDGGTYRYIYGGGREGRRFLALDALISV